MGVGGWAMQTVKENPSVLLSHSDSKQRPHVNNVSDDKKEQRKKKASGIISIVIIFLPIETPGDSKITKGNYEICLVVNLLWPVVTTKPSRSKTELKRCSTTEIAPCGSRDW